MKINFLHKVSLVVFILAIAFTGCKKAKENKIKGTWERTKIEALSSASVETWVFSDSYYYKIINPGISGKPDTTNWGSFHLKSGLSKTTITMAQTGYPITEWEVVKLSKDKLELAGKEPKGGIIYLEFTKK